MPKISALNTIAQLSTSSILPVVDDNQTQKVTLKRVIEFVSASIDVTFATEIELLQSASSITSSLNAFASASILNVNAKLSTSSFEAYTASVQSVNTSSLLTTSSFNTYTSSNDTTNTTQNSRLTSLENNSGSYLLKTQTGSFALTSSNNFTGKQTFSDVIYASQIQNLSGSVYISTPGNNVEIQGSNLVVPNGGIITSFNVSANSFTGYIDWNYIQNSPSLITSSNQITNLGFATTSSLPVVAPFLSSSTFNSYTSSNDSKWNTLGGQTGSFITEAETGSFATTGSNTFKATQTIAGNLFLSSSFPLVYNNSSDNNMLFGLFDGSTIHGAYYQIFGNTYPNVVQRGGAEFVYDVRNNPNADFHIASFNGSNWTPKFVVNDNGAQVTGSLNVSDGITGSLDWVNLINVPSGIISGSSQITNLGFATTSSVSESVSALNAATSSYITSAQTSSMTVLSASFAQTASFLLGTVASASFATSASFSQTASEARNVVLIARNGNASTLGAGTIVHITGASGDNPIFNTASFDSETLSANSLGVLRNTSPSGADVEVLVNGIVTGVNTDPALGYVAGDILYLSSSGQFTRVQPQAPLQIVTIGQVLRAQQNNGSIYVNITNGWELEELHNVAINGVVNGDLLVYRSGSGLWTNSSSLELGLATTGSNTFIGDQTISGFGVSVLDLHGVNDGMWWLRLFNDTYNSTQSVFAGWVDNSGTAYIGNEVDTPINIYTNAQYGTPNLQISSSGLTIRPNLTITGSLHQSGTFYPDVIDWFSSSIQLGTGSYILTTDNNGVTQYHNYQNIALALNPYITGSLDTRYAASGSFETTGRGILSGSVSYTSLTNIPSGIVSGSSQITSLLPNGVISGSSQLPSGLVSGSSQVLGESGIISSSTQITHLGFISSSTDVTPFLSASIFNTFTSSYVVASGSFDSRINAIVSAGVPTGTISGSTQIVNLGFATTSSVLNIDTSSLVTTSSFQPFSASINTATSSLNSFTSSINTTIKTKLNDDNVLSGSISYGSLTGVPSGIVSSSTQIIAGLPSGTVSGSSQVLSGTNIVSSSTQITTLGFATTGSQTLSGNQTVNGNLVVTGSITAQTFIVSSSVYYVTASSVSGSSNFGNSLDDNHNFTGSVYITGSLSISGSLNLSPSASLGARLWQLSDVRDSITGSADGYLLSYSSASGDWVAAAGATAKGTVRLYIATQRANSSAFYFNANTRTASDSASPSADSAFMVTTNLLSRVTVYLRQDNAGPNSTIVGIGKNADGAAFSSATLITSSSLSLGQNTIQTWQFSGLTLNTFDSLHIYCDPTNTPGTMYGIVIID